MSSARFGLVDVYRSLGDPDSVTRVLVMHLFLKVHGCYTNHQGKS